MLGALTLARAVDNEAFWKEYCEKLSVGFGISDCPGHACSTVE